MANRASQKRPLKQGPKGGVPLVLLFGVGGLALALIGLVLALRPPGAVTNPTQSDTGPRLAVDQPMIDFGQVQVGKMVQASFVLSNSGDQPLQVLGEPSVEVREGC